MTDQNDNQDCEQRLSPIIPAIAPLLLRVARFNAAADQLFYWMQHQWVGRMDGPEVVQRWEEAKPQFRALLRDVLESLR